MRLFFLNAQLGILRHTDNQKHRPTGRGYQPELNTTKLMRDSGASPGWGNRRIQIKQEKTARGSQTEKIKTGERMETLWLRKTLIL